MLTDALGRFRVPLLPKEWVPALTAEKKGNSGQREFLASSQDWELVAPPLFVVCLIFMNSGCIIGENLPVLWA